MEIVVKKKLNIHSLDEMLADSKLKEKLLEANQPDEFILDSDIGIEARDQQDEMEARGWSEVKLSYDLSCCQGSGASFTFTDLDVFKLAGYYKEVRKVLDYYKPIRDLWKYCNDSQTFDFLIVTSRPNSFANHYCHSRTVDLDFEWGDILDLEDVHITEDSEIYTQYKEFQHDLQNAIQEAFYDEAGEIYRNLKRVLDYRYSEKGILSDLEIDEKTHFLDDGRGIDLKNLDIYSIEGIPYEKERDGWLILVDSDGKIYSQVGPSEQNFLDTSDQIDMGYSVAIKFSFNTAYHKAFTLMKENPELDFEVVSIKDIFPNGRLK